MTDGTLDEDMTILLGLHAHPGWLIDKCAACQASKRIMERFRELEAELAKRRTVQELDERVQALEPWIRRVETVLTKELSEAEARAEKAEKDAVYWHDLALALEREAKR